MISNKRKEYEKRVNATWGKVKENIFYFDKISHYHQKKDKISALQDISERTVNDIDFHNVFAFIDRTYSRIGQQFLYSKLLTIRKTHEFGEQEALISIFCTDINRRRETQVHSSSSFLN